MSRSYDVIVVGGGHAGAEAACAAGRVGARVLLVTSNLEMIGQMSCNPAIGGIAKGTVVREVDALGGVMGRAADRATLQFRMLNRSKGPAVWAPRAQCDRGLYRRAVRYELEQHQHLSFLQATVASLILKTGRVAGVVLADGSTVHGRSVILTAGTFLRGTIHVGTRQQIPAGRAGEPAAVDIAEQLDSLGLTVARFKTGTPPRIDGRSVDYRLLERQDGEMAEYRFSHYAVAERPSQRPCWLTWAGSSVKEIIQDHIHESALYGGSIAGRGPRYCPSIEDKIKKFPDAERHQVFLEPEGLDTEELYVNGLSTSLPESVQRRFLRAIAGLERARMTRAGYAIEYDYYPPTQLTPWLESKAIQGLFLAGQVNGTTGYEEAAGQGTVAGINAARLVRGADPLILGREDAYVGVLIDDLVTKGVDEPYRLFTSRAEFRLLLRQDNALRRLGQFGAELGMLRESERATIEERRVDEQALLELARATSIGPTEANTILARAGEPAIREPRSVADLVRRPAVRLRDLLAANGSGRDVAHEVLLTAEIELKYAGYLARERDSARRLGEMAAFELPGDLPYPKLQSLSFEAREKLNSIRPSSLAQAGRIPGVSPSDLQNLVLEVLRRRRTVA